MPIYLAYICEFYQFAKGIFSLKKKPLDLPVLSLAIKQYYTHYNSVFSYKLDRV